MLRGRNIINNIEPMKKTLKELLCELERNDWDKSRLIKNYSNLLNEYKLEAELIRIKEAKYEKRVKIIKNHILKLYGNEISNKYICIYLVGYCTSLNLDGSIKMIINKLCTDVGVRYSSYMIKKIIDSGINDGVYLGILNNDGTIKDQVFFRNWIYLEEDNTLNEVFKSYRRKLGTEEYNEKIMPLYNDRFYLKKQIEREKIEIIFPYITRKKIKQNDKIRTVYEIQQYSLTEITIKYLKKRLDIVFDIKYSDRNKIMRELFNLIENINALDNYTIYKFDIKDFFDSVNARIIIEKYIFNSKLNQYEKNILKRLSDNYNFCFAGLPTSNALTEIAGHKFDEMIQFNLKNDGMIFYSRYVDDGLIIFNKKVSKTSIEEQLKNTLKNCFHDNIEFNEEKEKYFIKESRQKEFSYLGYKFEGTNSNDFLFGIEEDKINKYKKKINEIVNEYLSDGDIELLRQRINYFISRIVFYNNDNSRYSSIGNWDIRGLSANYCLLRKYIKEHKINKSTERFLKSEIIIAVNKGTRGGTHCKFPYFLKKSGKDCYSLEYGIKKNKSIVFHPNIGWSQEHLKGRIVKLGYSSSLNKKSYRECLKIYCDLIKL